MLTGAILGAIIVFLVFLVIFLQGKNTILMQQVTALNKAQAEVDNQLQRAVGLLQEAQKPYIVNFKDEEIMKIASMIIRRVETIMNSQNEAALLKMN